MYEVVYKRRALRALRRMPPDTANRIIAKIEDVARNPFAPEHDVAALQGRPGYRLRVGGWRVIFLLRKAEMVLLVLDIRPRGDAYK